MIPAWMRISLLIACWFCFIEASAQSTFVQTRERLLNNPAVQRGQVSWSFRDIASGQELDAHQSNKLMVPASVLKTFTTALALTKLQGTFAFETKVLVKGKIKRSSLRGDLMVMGSGDPSFGSGLAGSMPGDSVLAQISRMLSEAGIERIVGDLVIDPYALPYDHRVISPSWIWEDLGNYYGAGAFGLNWRNNEFTVTLEPAKNHDDSCRIASVSNWAKHLELVNKINSAYDTEEDVYLFSAPFSSKVFLSGVVKRRGETFTERGALPDPPLAFGLELREYLETHGVKVDGVVKIAAAETSNAQVWKVFRSPDLRALVSEVNQNSNNLFAECLGKKLGYAYSESGGDALERYLSEYKPEADLAMRFDDASGLSRKNRISTAFQSRFLRNQTHSTEFPYFLGSLPKAGEEGTLKSFRKIDQLRAKSGSMEGVRAYAGYFFDAANHWISFSVIFNQVPAKGSEQKELIATLLESASKHAFDLPFPYAPPGMLRDTILRLRPVLDMLERFNNPELYKDDERPDFPIKPEIVFQGEPDVYNPYWLVVVSVGNNKFTSRVRLRVHAQTRRIEQDLNNDSNWRVLTPGP
jgi:D-alanyl-D-alanine carboxypeptidase/D-alanyl-D-alanine-endopeptidase (penicillin-binding protein 4)